MNFACARWSAVTWCFSRIENTERRDPRRWQAVVGHVMISVVIAPLVVGVLWLLGLIMQPGAGVGAIVVLGLVTTVASEVLMALGERPAVVRARHSTPGGWGYAMWVFVVPPLVGFAVGWWESPRVAVPTALAALIVFWAVGL